MFLDPRHSLARANYRVPVPADPLRPRSDVSVYSELRAAELTLESVHVEMIETSQRDEQNTRKN